MHPLFAKASSLTEGIIAGAIEVHKDKGPGLVESIYEWCLTKELTLRQLRVENQRLVSISYKGFLREEPLRFDLLVESCVLIETKAGRTSHAHPQGTTLELYETPQRASRPAHQF